MMTARTLIPLLLLLASANGHSQDLNLRLPISLDADSTNYDGKNSMLMFRGLRLSQGTIGVEADEGRASKLDFKDSVWHFSGNVIIDVDNGHIECDSAALQFTDHLLTIATIEGNPATFELKRLDGNEVTYAEAGKLEYDLRQGIIEFSENAKITEAGNQISSNTLVYNIKERRVNAMSSGEGDEKVKIIYTPTEDLSNDANEVESESGIESNTEDATPDSEDPSL